MACSKLLGRKFEFEKDFINDVLVDCNYHDSQPDPKDALIRFYLVVEDKATLLVLCLLDWHLDHKLN